MRLDKYIGKEIEIESFEFQKIKAGNSSDIYVRKLHHKGKLIRGDRYSVGISLEFDDNSVWIPENMGFIIKLLKQDEILENTKKGPYR